MNSPDQEVPQLQPSKRPSALRLSISIGKQKIRFALWPLISMLLAVITLMIPIQLYFPLGRYQHYGLAVVIWGFGYIWQAIWAWHHYKKWSRLSYLLGGVYLSSLGLFFYANPWLDPRVGVETDTQVRIRYLASRTFLYSSLPLLLIWIQGYLEEGKKEK